MRRVGDNETLDLINGQVLDLPNGLLKQMAANPSVVPLQYDRPIKTHNYRTAVTVGARSVQEYYGLHRRRHRHRGHRLGHHRPGTTT